jgi:hypothetical protein
MILRQNLALYAHGCFAALEVASSGEEAHMDVNTVMAICAIFTVVIAIVKVSK